MSEIKKIHVFPEFGTKEFNDLAFTYCGGKLKQKGKAITKEEVMEGRSNAYDFIDFDKQETLEEASTNYANKNFSTKDPVADEGWYASWLGFRNGAKWQQERSYSEEDMKSAFKVGFNIGYGGTYYSHKESACESWFEKFKKK